MTRVAVVTGVLGGIGAATAGLFHRDGWQVIGIDRTNSTTTDLDEFWNVDLADIGADEVLAGRLTGLARIDVLVNNAGLQVERPLIQTEVRDWDRVMATNVRAAYLAIKHAHAGLRAAKGAVVNVSSVHSMATSPGLAAYAASKGALTALTRSAALELADDAIRVNAVLPGAIDTQMLRQGVTGRAPGDETALLAELAGRIPLRRLGQSADVAHAILFLADAERSGYITGQTLVVDGGSLSRLSSE
jgi:NAD(P)-dependent dehydrogenase (short-subunit alcohol dehydrogenase family)